MRIEFFTSMQKEGINLLEDLSFFGTLKGRGNRKKTMV